MTDFDFIRFMEGLEGKCIIGVVVFVIVNCLVHFLSSGEKKMKCFLGYVIKSIAEILLIVILIYVFVKCEWELVIQKENDNRLTHILMSVLCLCLACCIFQKKQEDEKNINNILWRTLYMLCFGLLSKLCEKMTKGSLGKEDTFRFNLEIGNKKDKNNTTDP